MITGAHSSVLSHAAGLSRRCVGSQKGNSSVDFVQEGGQQGSERRRWVGVERGPFGQEAHEGRGPVVGMAGPLRIAVEIRFPGW